MSKPRSALGRGLGALIPGADAPGGTSAPPARGSDEAAQAAPGDASAAGDLLELPLDRIVPNPEQPRRQFEREQLERLAGSIRQHGVLQPVVVRRAGERFELLVGERRWRACREAGLATIPALVSDAAPQERLTLALIENVQRHDLNPIELALAFRQLGEAGLTQEQVGEAVGLDRSTVSNHLRMLDLPRELQEDVEFGRLTAGHAKALLQLSNPERRRWLRDRIVAEGLSVRAAEEAASAQAPAARTRKSARARPQDPNLADLVDRLRRSLQTRVRVTGTAQRGRIEIEYFGPEDLDRLAKRILEGR